MKTFSEKARDYFTNLNYPPALPGGVEIVNPYKSGEVKRVVTQFFDKYFNDNNKRIFILGINPGRFGGGLTGISFTDPVALEEECAITNNLGGRRELSSRFIYNLIGKLGGPPDFYSKYFIGALFPLALVKDGKNYNYYDNARLQESLTPAIAEAIRMQVGFGAESKFAVSLGKRNAILLKKINEEYGFFDEIRIAEHPRYIMQYKLKKLDYYLEKYTDMLT